MNYIENVHFDMKNNQPDHTCIKCSCVVHIVEITPATGVQTCAPNTTVQVLVPVCVFREPNCAPTARWLVEVTTHERGDATKDTNKSRLSWICKVVSREDTSCPVTSAIKPLSSSLTEPAKERPTPDHPVVDVPKLTRT